jgi:hypothetical protein
MKTNSQGFISELEPNEIFVFGSNESGLHGGGAARQAYQSFGAIMHEGIGLFGNTYAIPTIGPILGNVLKLDKIKSYIDDFILFAKTRPDLVFYMTEIGCGIAGLKVEQVAPLFDENPSTNVLFPKSFISFIKNSKTWEI